MELDLPQIKNLVLASPCKATLCHWEKGLHNFAELHQIDNPSLLMEQFARIKPDILLFDYELANPDPLPALISLRRLSPGTKIVVFKNFSTEEEEWALFKIGVRGCCSNSIDSQSLINLVKAIQKGELWIRRSLIHHLLGQLLDSSPSANHKVDHSCLSLLEHLTQREYEIAVRVRNGENNKQIALSLNITDRTVKAHLSEIFRKLGVTDRHKVAAILSGDKRRIRRTS